ncbi:AEL_HP2_G0025700.mRNA.1.CDS.1 [Saccharomyces cerevisiae]|nr:AEL_HP2_G0025700.mRNA.1.CDS.1 [Saccharomyces cerevisiae]CAI6459863.1 AEL_HP2_G0025700.mRNA.1.CDS.1 [Saccharomyces cerevisiae]
MVLPQEFLSLIERGVELEIHLTGEWSPSDSTENQPGEGSLITELMSQIPIKSRKRPDLMGIIDDSHWKMAPYWLRLVVHPKFVDNVEK